MVVVGVIDIGVVAIVVAGVAAALVIATSFLLCFPHYNSEFL